MSIYNNRPVLLPNTFGDLADSFIASATPSADSAPLYDLISGGRQNIARWARSTSSRTLTYAASLAVKNLITHIVVARADLALRNNTGSDLGFEAQWYHSTTSTWVNFPNAYRDISDLIGIDAFGLGHGQDLVFENNLTTWASNKARLIANYGSSIISTGLALSKFYACSAFDFGIGPVADPRPAWKPVQSEYARYFKPFNGHITYEISDIIRLIWPRLTQSKFEDFTQVSQLLNWPLFIYDPSSYLWVHKLEHVVVQSYKWTQQNPHHGNLEVTFGRLRHYE